MKKLAKKIVTKNPFLNRLYENERSFKISEAEMKEFKNDFQKFREMTQNSSQSKNRLTINWEDKWPRLHDKSATSDLDLQYTFFVAWAVRKVKEINPKFHVDFSSSLHFATTLSAFIPVKFYDYRPLEVLNVLDNLKSGAADLVNLENFKDESISCLSSMHVIEHIGLGRYGDPLDPDGDIKAIKELKRVLAKDGDLLFVIPIGQGKVQFNAHRLYKYDQVLEQFADLELQEFSLITDPGAECTFVINATKELSDQQTYSTGCFWFKKK